MPELPEVDALVADLRLRIVGDFVERAMVAELSLLKTVDPRLDALAGLEITDVTRRGKALTVVFDGLFLVCRFARAGWLVWHDEVPGGPVKLGKGPLGLRVRLASRAGFDLTEAGTKKNASVALVRDLAEVPALAHLGPDVLSLDVEELASIVGTTKAHIKTVLEDQSLIAGVGNAFSDEILHLARLSPFAPAERVDAARLHAAVQQVLGDVRERLIGLPAAKVKAAKKRLLRIHGRTGQLCPVCSTTIAEVSFADKSLNYCPGCQTGGRRLSDRRMDRLLK